uniref:Translocation/assembly module TamB domain-containing protein n=1 Tax=Prevotella sp. GTC17260 TaxID=3236796 RepID=A0AB33JEA2_9BACT
MKKKLKWVAVIILTPILLFVILALLLYFPPFQNWAVARVAAYASEQTGMEISVEHVSLEFPLDLGVEGIKVIRQNDSLPQQKDTVADIRKVVVDVQLWPLLKKQVQIDELAFSQLKVNTTDFIHEARVKGIIGELNLKAHGIDLKAESVKIEDANLKDAKVNIELSDTVPPDTSQQKNFWKITVNRLNVERTDVTVHMPGDTLQVQAYLGKAVAEDGYFDLYKERYQVRKFDWSDGRLKYDNNFEIFGKGLDYNHLLISNISLGLDSLDYSSPKLSLHLRACQFDERSGLQVQRLAGRVQMDSTRLYLPSVILKTSESSLNGDFDMDLNAFADQNPGKFNATVHGRFGKQDLMVFMGEMPSGFRRAWPNYPLSVDGVVRGNMKRIALTGVNVKLPSAFDVRATGYVLNPTDAKHLKASLDLKAASYRMDFLTSLLDKELMKTVRVPEGITFDGHVDVNGQTYASTFVAGQGGGRLSGTARFDAARMAYTARLMASRLPVQNFVPHMGLHPFTGFVDVSGVGTDMLSPRTRLTAKARIQKFRYGKYNLDNMMADATVSRGLARADIVSQNDLLKGNIHVDAKLNSRHVDAKVACSLGKADFYHLRIAESPLTASMRANVALQTDMKHFYMVKGSMQEVVIDDGKHVYRPGDLDIDLLTRRDTTHAVLNCGDFHLRMNGSGGYEWLMGQANGFMDEVQLQLKNKRIDQVRLWQKLPDANLYLMSGKDNFFVNMLNRYGYHFASANINMVSSPVTGLNGRLQIDSLVADSMQLDTVRFNIYSTDNAFTYHAQVRNNAKNPQYVFNAIFDGGLHERGANLKARLYDGKDKLGVGFGLTADMEANGILLHMDDHPVLGYKQFSVNDSNFVFLGDNRRVRADLKLRSADGMGVQVYSNDDNADALQDITFSLNQFDLKKVLSVVPYTPDLAGVLNGDYHLIQTQDELSVSSNMMIDNMVYEKSPMGNVGAEFVYMPKSDGSHYVDGILMHNGNEVATVKGTYLSKGDGYLDATLGFDRLPLLMMNGFIPQQLFGFKGYAEGSLDMKGSLSKPDINGELYVDSAYLVSQPYGVEMRFDNDPVTISDSRLLFENFMMYSHNESPLIMSGYLDFADLNNMLMDVRMRADNFLLIDAKENLRSETFGKAYVDFFGRMNGRVENLQMRGKLNVLGATDMTYILRDSELSTDTQLDELVKFTDLQDSIQEVVERPKPEGFNMALAISIDEGAHIVCALNADKTNYIDLMGGGDLQMTYNEVDFVGLKGRYTLNSGEMKYSLPIIPLKTFNIQDGSYLSFTGDPMNPNLHITATENVKATVNESGSNGRVVDFTCGVKLSKTLSKPGVEFIIDAPNDMGIADELNTMSTEGRGKVAITMLASGMYLTDGNTSSFSMNSALSSFLQAEINKITGTAMRSMGLDIGMSVDNATTSSGAMHTDYNFRFAKRLWNNRLKIIVGGKVSTGSELEQNRSNTFFDNVEMQYRLDQKSSKYLRLFYNNSTYDWLEGVIGEYGVGFKWRRKLDHFKDIFRFHTPREDVIPALSADSVKMKKKK